MHDHACIYTISLELLEFNNFFKSMCQTLISINGKFQTPPKNPLPATNVNLHPMNLMLPPTKVATNSSPKIIGAAEVHKGKNGLYFRCSNEGRIPDPTLFPTIFWKPTNWPFGHLETKFITHLPGHIFFHWTMMQEDYTPEIWQRVYPWKMMGKEDDPVLSLNGIFSGAMSGSTISTNLYMRKSPP